MVSYEKQLEFEFMKRNPDYEFPTYTVDPLKDDVNRPEHYTLGKIEVFDFIKAWDLSFAEGNVVKYTVRAPYKGNRLKDLKKARWYLDKLIEEASNGG